MNIVFLLAAQTAKTTADHIRGILGALIIPAVILIIVLIGKAVGKRSAKKNHRRSSVEASVYRIFRKCALHGRWFDPDRACG